MAADHWSEEMRGDFWARGWAAYERRHPSDSLVIAEALLCSGIPPAREDLRRMVAAVGAMVPVSVEPGLGPVEDPDRYFHEVNAGAGQGERGLRAVLGPLAVAPLPPAGADMWLVRGYEPGAFALVPRVHHRVADGVGASGIVGPVSPGSWAVPGRPPRSPDRKRGTGSRPEHPRACWGACVRLSCWPISSSASRPPHRWHRCRAGLGARHRDTCGYTPAKRGCVMPEPLSVPASMTSIWRAWQGRYGRGTGGGKAGHAVQ